MNITIPYGYSSDLENDITFQAFLIWKSSPSENDILYFYGSGPVKLRIKQYGSLLVKRNILDDRIPVGEWRTVTLSILNEGNGIDTFHIEIIEKSDGVESELEKDAVIIPPGDSSEVELRIRQRYGMAESNKVMVKVWSDFPGKENETLVNIHFRTRFSFKPYRIGFWSPVVVSTAVLFTIFIGWYLFFHGGPAWMRRMKRVSGYRRKGKFHKY
jgi:hypothetical protein